MQFVELSQIPLGCSPGTLRERSELIKEMTIKERVFCLWPTRLTTKHEDATFSFPYCKKKHSVFLLLSYFLFKIIVVHVLIVTN